VGETPVPAAASRGFRAARKEGEERSGRDPGPRRRESRLSRRQERGSAFPQVFYSARFGIAASPHSPPNIPSQHAICYMAERESGWAQRKAPLPTSCRSLPWAALLPPPPC